MENLLNPGETEIFNALKYRRYTSTGLYVGNYWIPAGATYWVNDAGLLHREDGPAIEHANGTKYWFRYGLRHREGGPAIEYLNGYKEWWINGKFIRSE